MPTAVTPLLTASPGPAEGSCIDCKAGRGGTQLPVKACGTGAEAEASPGWGAAPGPRAGSHALHTCIYLEWDWPTQPSRG